MAWYDINGISVWTNMDSEKFKQEAELWVKNYEALKEYFTKGVRAIYQKYAGKPYNNRFVLELQAAALNIDENIVFGCSGQYDNGVFYHRVGTTYAGISGSGSMTLHVVTEDVTDKKTGETVKVINAAASMHSMKPWKAETVEDELQQQADNCRRCITDYDEFMAIAADCKKAVKRYNELPWVFHSYIHAEDMKAY